MKLTAQLHPLAKLRMRRTKGLYRYLFPFYAFMMYRDNFTSTVSEVMRKQIAIYIYIYIYVQGVPGGMCNTSGGCSLGQTIPI